MDTRVRRQQEYEMSGKINGGSEGESTAKGRVEAGNIGILG